MEIYVLCRMGQRSREKLFNRIFSVYQKRLRFFIRNITPDDTEDIFQDIMLKIFVNLEKYNPVYSFNTWVYTIARNHCLNFVRKHVLPVEAECRSLRTEAPGPEARILNGELNCAIDAALATLPEESREIAFLRFFENMRHKDIAIVVNIPEGTVKSRLNKIRTQLKQALEAYRENR